MVVLGTVGIFCPSAHLHLVRELEAGRTRLVHRRAFSTLVEVFAVPGVREQGTVWNPVTLWGAGDQGGPMMRRRGWHRLLRRWHWLFRRRHRLLRRRRVSEQEVVAVFAGFAVGLRGPEAFFEPGGELQTSRAGHPHGGTIGALVVEAAALGVGEERARAPAAAVRNTGGFGRGVTGGGPSGRRGGWTSGFWSWGLSRSIGWFWSRWGWANRRRGRAWGNRRRFRPWRSGGVRKFRGPRREEP